MLVSVHLHTERTSRLRGMTTKQSTPARGCQSMRVFSSLVASVAATTNAIGAYAVRSRRRMSASISVVWPPEPSTTIARFGCFFSGAAVAEGGAVGDAR